MNMTNLPNIQFVEKDFTVPLLGKDRKYKVWYRPLWEWTLDLLSNSSLLSHFTWNAERLYKYDGAKFVRFVDEPWTGNRHWEIQVRSLNSFLQCSLIEVF